MIIEILRDHGLGKGINGADKKALIELVNAADSNQSTVKTKIINALKAKDATLNLAASSTWIDIHNAIPLIFQGKKWAFGTIAIPGASSQNPVTINGLNFIPKTLFAFASYDPTSTNPSIHCCTAFPTYSNPTPTGWRKIDNWASSVFALQTSAPTSGSFVLCNVSSSSYTDYVRWIAFE